MTDTQMYVDHGPESFLGEVISIIKLTRLHIDIEPDPLGPDVVRVEVRGIIPDRYANEFFARESGRSYGQALRKVREQLRMEVGR